MIKITLQIKIFLWLALLLTSQNLWAVPIPTFTVRFPVFSKDNSQLVYISSDFRKREIVKTSISSGKVLKHIPLSLPNNLQPIAATPDGFKILAVNARGIAVIHNGTGKILRVLSHPATKRDSTNSIQSPDGVWLAVPSISPQSRKIYIMHTGSGKIVHTLDLLKNEKWVRYPKVTAIGFSLNRRLIAYEIQSTKKLTLHVFDIYQKKEIAKLDLPKIKDHHYKISFSKNEKMILLSGADRGKNLLINMQNHSITELPYDYSNFIDFTPEDNLIIIQSHKNIISLYNTQTGKIKNTPFQSQFNTGYYGNEIIQSTDRSTLALPISTTSFKNINQITFINTRTGQQRHPIPSATQ